MANIKEAIYKLQNYVLEVETKAKEKSLSLSEEGKNQVKEIAEKTVSTINSSIVKLQDLSDSVMEESQLSEFLERLDNKCRDIVGFTIEKINEVKSEEVKKEVKEEEPEELVFTVESDDEKTSSKVSMNFSIDETINKLLENPNIKNATEFAKKGVDKAIEFYNSEQTQEFINTMKIKTIDIAEKGLEGLKVLLDRVDEKK